MDNFLISSNNKSKTVDGLKGIAICGVIMFHLLSYFFRVPDIIKIMANFGGAGVHVFLICSGFGLAYSYRLKEFKFISFFINRFIKIYIPYIIIIFISFFVISLYDAPDRVPALLSHIFLIKMFVPKYENSFGLQFWYISTIFQFYLSFGILLIIKRKLGNRRYIIGAICINLVWSTIITYLGIYEERVFNSFFLQYLWEFCIGMCIADYYAMEKKLPIDLINWYWILFASILSCIIYASMALTGGALKNYNDAFSVISFGGVCILILRVTVFEKIFVWINGISYEMYLTHILIFTLIIKGTEEILPNTISTILSLLILLVISYIYHQIISVRLVQFIRNNIVGNKILE